MAYLITCNYCGFRWIKMAKPNGIRSLNPTLCPECGQVGGTMERYEVYK